jgi:hypothetical protein
MTPQEQRQLVLTLLDHWHDFYDVASSGNIATGDTSSGLPLLSSMSRHGSVVELGRCLLEVRRMARGHFAAVVAYFDAPIRNVDREVMRRLPSGRFVKANERVRERVLPRHLLAHPRCRCGCAMPRPVCLAVDVVCALWRPDVACELPVGLIAKVRVRVDVESGEHVFTQAA